MHRCPLAAAATLPIVRQFVLKSEHSMMGTVQGLLAHLKEFQSRLLDRDTVRSLCNCIAPCSPTVAAMSPRAPLRAMGEALL